MCEKKTIRLILFLVIIGSCQNILSQDKNQAFSFGGYLSAMQSNIFETFQSDWLNDNLIHNRLNLKIYAGSRLTFGAEFRNRIFTGDMPSDNPAFSETTGSDKGWLDMSWNIIDEPSVLLNTFVDRLWIDLSGNKYQLRIGRQRINWGQAFVWNPNDIFNVYSYFDFDYPERPGSDAIRLQLYPSFSSAIELAAKIDSEEKLTAAALYRFNALGYDFQVLGGYANGNDWVMGAGWSGSVKNIGFRGELSWFQPRENVSDTSGTGLFTIGLDRTFNNSAGLQLQVLYCNSPLDVSNFESLYTGSLSAKDLAFSELSLFASFIYPLNPLINIGLSAIYYPGLDGYFAGPSLDASLAGNTDLSLLWQHFDAKAGQEELLMNIVFLRFKYSF